MSARTTAPPFRHRRPGVRWLAAQFAGLALMGCAERMDDRAGGRARPADADDGFLSVVAVHVADEPATAFVEGEFFRLTSPGDAAVVFEEPARVDDCAVTTYTLSELAQGVLPTYDHESAGVITLTADGVTHELAVGVGGLYYAELDAGSLPFGGGYVVDAPGDTFPAFSAELEVPESCDLTVPGAGFAPDGDLNVQWTGGDPGEMRLRVEGADSQGHRGLVDCRVDNDGAHVVPAALVDRLPTSLVTVHLEQTQRDEVVVEGRRVSLAGSVVNIVFGGAP